MSENMSRKEEKAQGAALSPAIYRALDARTALKAALAGAAVFLAALWASVPVKDMLLGAVESRMASMQGCPVAYDDLGLFLLPPRVELTRVSLDGSCLGRGGGGEGLSLDLVELRFTGLGFLPLGMNFAARARGHGSEVNVQSSLSLGEQRARVTRTRISAGLINDLAGLDPVLSGNIDVEASLSIRDGRPREARFRASSDDLSTLRIDVQGIGVPRLAIGTLDVRGTLDDGRTLNIERADIGDAQADVVGRFKGTVALDQLNPPASTADIEGSFFPGDKLTTAIPLVGLLLRGKTAEDGFYRLRLSGPLGALQPEFL